MSISKFAGKWWTCVWHLASGVWYLASGIVSLAVHQHSSGTDLNERFQRNNFLPNPRIDGETDGDTSWNQGPNDIVGLSIWFHLVWMKLYIEKTFSVVVAILTIIRASQSHDDGFRKFCGSSCHHGACIFEKCERTECPGGGCTFLDSADSSCLGGGCTFKNCVRSSCDGGR